MLSLGSDSPRFGNGDYRTPYPFHLLIKPIGPLCNLECKYCFYLDKSRYYPDAGSFRMTDDTLAAMTRMYIDHQPEGTREVNFAWQGGEPTLMGLKFFQRAVELQQRFARPGMTISNALQTNGTLLDGEWARFLYDNGFLVGISIDGPEELHDEFRSSRRGVGSFARVMKGLSALQRQEVEFNTLTVVGSRNSRDPERVFAFLKDIGSTFLQFIPAIDPGGVDDGGRPPWAVSAAALGDFLVGVFDRWSAEDIGRIYVQQFETMLGIAMGLPAALCVNAVRCGRNLAVEHNGDVYSCDHYVYPEYRLGNVHHGSISHMIDGRRQSLFGLYKSNSLPRQCRRCEYLAYCRGGCPKERTARTVDGEEGLNRLCDGYRRFFRHTDAHFRAMATCLRRGLPAARYHEFIDTSRRAGYPSSQVAGRRPGRNEPCTCGSGRKYKHCCGRARPH